PGLPTACGNGNWEPQAVRPSIAVLARPSISVIGLTDPLTFARALGTNASTGEARATHRRMKRHYKTRMRMPSKLDPPSGHHRGVVFARAADHRTRSCAGGTQA